MRKSQVTMPTDLDGVVQTVLLNARTHGTITTDAIQGELELAGQPADRWRDVVLLAGPRLRAHQGGYRYVPPLAARTKQGHRRLLAVRRAARELSRAYHKTVVERERREHRRIHFLLPITVLTADGRELRLVSQDLSPTGIRFLGPCDLKGQKVKIRVPGVDRGDGQWTFAIQVLWSEAIGDGLIQNGGIFQEVEENGRPAK